MVTAPIKPPPQFTEEALAQAISELSAGVRRLLAGRLKRDTIILLLHDASKVGKRDIAQVLLELERLEQTYLKPVPTKK